MACWLPGEDFGLRLNLPVSSPVLPVCHDDADWCVGSSMSESSPASLVLTQRERMQLGRRTRPARSQPMVVPDSTPVGMAESFFSALNSSVAWVLFHKTESPALVW
jgi:hypothetical protein